MVAETIKFPNIRKMFKPDPGYMLIDVDLERADAQVVAWEANDEELKEIFREGKDIHTENAVAVYKCKPEDADKGGSESPRQKVKQGVHAANYDSTPSTLSEETGMTLAEATFFIKRWFELHPKIKDWHNRIKQELTQTHTVKNAFGFKRYFFDRTDIKKFHEALAWIPQSTVANCIDIAMANIHRDLPEVQLLLQVHDSLVMQAPLELCPAIYPKILSAMRVVVPYPDPLIIPVSLAASPISWGDVEKPKGLDLDAAKIA